MALEHSLIWVCVLHLYIAHDVFKVGFGSGSWGCRVHACVSWHNACGFVFRLEQHCGPCVLGPCGLRLDRFRSGHIPAAPGFPLLRVLLVSDTVIFLSASLASDTVIFLSASLASVCIAYSYGFNPSIIRKVVHLITFMDYFLFLSFKNLWLHTRNICHLNPCWSAHFRVHHTGVQPWPLSPELLLSCKTETVPTRHSVPIPLSQPLAPTILPSVSVELTALGLVWAASDTTSSSVSGLCPWA